jgi:hypothetical protein
VSGPFYEVGGYIGEVTEQALGKAKTGTPQFCLKFRVLGKPDPADPSSFIPVQQYERTIYRAITPNTIKYVVEDLEKLGYEKGGFGPLDPSHSDHQSFVGMQIDTYCSHENNAKGDLAEKWGLARGASALKVDPIDSKGVRELDALFGKSLKAKLPQKAAAPKPEPVLAGGPPPFSEEVSDDDVPF